MLEHEWIPLQYIDDIDSSIITTLQVDTRDFCFIATDTIADTSTGITADMIGNNLYEFSTVVDILKKLYHRSGGESEWRCLCLDCDGLRNWELKYIRCYKFAGRWLICDYNNVVLDHESLQSPVLSITNTVCP